MQSGKPVGVFRTHEDAPRVLIANSNLVPHWATWDHFNELDRKGLMMYGQMTAGSWIYIGTQGIVQGTYETFAEAGRQHYGGNLKGNWILTGGLGGMGGAQPLAAVMAGACCLAVECDETRIDFRLRTRYVDAKAETLDEALAMIDALDARRARRSRSACSATPPTSSPNWSAAKAGGRARHRHRPDLGPRSAARLPAAGLDAWPSGARSRRATRRRWRRPPAPRCRRMSRRWSTSGTPACRRSTTATTSARWRKDEGLENAFAFPGFVPAYIRPLFCRGIGPFRWAALSGDPEDIYKTDAKVKELFPDNTHLHRWLDMARERIAFQGLPARICWVGLGDRHRARPRLQRDGARRAN